MFRTTSLTAVCLILTFSNSAVAQKPFKNKTALAAQKTYEEAIAKAKKEYVAQLDIAIKDAGGVGDIDEANRIVAEKKGVQSDEGGVSADPFGRLRKRIEGTTWLVSTSKLTLFFGKNGAAINSKGVKMAWSTGGKNVLVLQSSTSSNIYVWQLDKNLQSATQTGFFKSKTVYAPARRIGKKRR